MGTYNSLLQLLVYNTIKELLEKKNLVIVEITRFCLVEIRGLEPLTS